MICVLGNVPEQAAVRPANKMAEENLLCFHIPSYAYRCFCLFRWTQIIVALTVPVVASLIFFAHPLIRVWLRQRIACRRPCGRIAAPLIALGTLDITYIQMSRGFAYLAVVLDWFSRRVRSWRLSIGMEAAFCVETLEDALARHGKPDIFNTDQGSADYRRGIHWLSDQKRDRHQHGLFARRHPDQSRPC